MWPQEVKRSARAVPSPTAVELRIRTRAEEESADVNNIISDLQHRRHPGLFQVSMAAPRALHLQQLNIMTIGINSADIYREARVGGWGGGRAENTTYVSAVPNEPFCPKSEPERQTE